MHQYVEAIMFYTMTLTLLQRMCLGDPGILGGYQKICILYPLLQRGFVQQHNYKDLQ